MSWRSDIQAPYIVVRRGTFGLIYIVVGGPDDGRPLMAEEYSYLLGQGVPVVREAAAR